MTHSVADFAHDDDDFISVLCTCGWGVGPFVDDETAIDSLMEHAYNRGYEDAHAESRGPE